MKQISLLRWRTDELSGKKLKQLCDTLNSCQKHGSFKFISYDSVLDFPTKMGTNHIYTYEQLFQKIKDANTGIQHKVGIIDMPLGGACFNKQNITDHVGVVTLHDIDEYNLKELSTRKYLSYLVLCVAMCLVSDMNLEEDHEPNKCLFDYCQDIKRFKKCLSDPLICSSCIEKLSTKLKDTEMEDLNSLLKYATRKNFFFVLWATIKSASFFYGMLTSSLLTLVYKFANITATTPPVGATGATTSPIFTTASFFGTPEGWVISGAIGILLLITTFRKIKK